MHKTNRIASGLFLRLTVLVAVAVTLPVTQLRAQALAEAPASIRHTAAIEAGRDIIRRTMEEHSIPGMSVAVGVDGDIVWSEGFGFADLEQRTPATTLTRFRIGSVSKPVTAAAIGKLYQESRLDLDAPIQQYVPDFPEKRWPITTRQLGGHLAGIRHYEGDEMLNDHRYETVEEGLTIFADDPLLHQPDSAYEYSSYGWNLISAVIEGASGDEFLPYMRREVFLPLGLRSIVAEHTDSIIAHRASFYELSDEGEVLNAPYVDNSYKWAGGGFISNTEDLIGFAYGMLDGSLLEPSTVHVLFSPQSTTSGDATNYGIGWRSGVDDAGRRWIGHTGGSVGGRAVLTIYPDQNIVVAALANLGSAPMSPELAAELAEGFVTQP